MESNLNMRIYVDNMEKITLGKNVMANGKNINKYIKKYKNLCLFERQKNLLIEEIRLLQSKLALNKSSQESEYHEINFKLHELARLRLDIIHELDNKYYENDNNTLTTQIDELNQQVNLIDNILYNKSFKYEFPSFLQVGTNMGIDIKEKNIHKFISQGDFFIENEEGKQYMIELSATFATLYDKIRNPQPILDSFEQAKRANLAYRFLVVLPPHDEVEKYMDGQSKFSFKSFSIFISLLKKSGLNPKYLHMSNRNFFQPHSEYFMDKRNENYLNHKHELILGQVILMTTSNK